MYLSEFKSKAVLMDRSSMKQVMGGYGSCGYRDSNGYSMCGLSQAEAQFMASGPGYYWCCASCGGNGGGASYC